jgi:hypothetical protein
MPRVTNTIRTDANGNTKTLTRVPSYYNNFTSVREDLTQSELASKATTSSRTSSIDPGNIIKDVTCSAGVRVEIKHKLNRKYQGFTVHRQRGTHPISLVEVPQNSEELDRRQITLSSFTDCVVDVEIY